jgi:hypothetical protein
MRRFLRLEREVNDEMFDKSRLRSLALEGWHASPAGIALNGLQVHASGTRDGERVRRLTRAGGSAPMLQLRWFQPPTGRISQWMCMALGNPGFHYARKSCEKRDSRTGIPWPHDDFQKECVNGSHSTLATPHTDRHWRSHGAEGFLPLLQVLETSLHTVAGNSKRQLTGALADLKSLLPPSTGKAVHGSSP